MDTATRIGRLGVLAVGLGIGAVVASTGTASAQTDIDISIDGVDIFNGGGSALATSVFGDAAIAIGPNSIATAKGGFGDFALALSTVSTGSAGSCPLPACAEALAGDPTNATSGNNFDFASAVGSQVVGQAGLGNSGFPPGNSFDFASAVGFNSGVSAHTNATAGFGGSGDYASALGENSYAEAGDSDNPLAPANFDIASVLGGSPTTGAAIEANAGGAMTDFGGSLDSAFVFDPFATASTITAQAGAGGSVDSAFVVDPFGTTGSTAEAGTNLTNGMIGSFDLAGALGDGFNATATGGNFLVDIMP